MQDSESLGGGGGGGGGPSEYRQAPFSNNLNTSGSMGGYQQPTY